MTVGELIDALECYDAEMNVKVENTKGEVFDLTDEVWQLDNSTYSERLNTYLTINVI